MHVARGLSYNFPVGGGGICVYNSTLKIDLENTGSFFGNSADYDGGTLVKYSCNANLGDNNSFTS